MNFFFMAPLLCVFYEPNMRDVYNPPDWRPWVGFMAVLNVIGIISYLCVQRFVFNHTGPSKKIWIPNHGKATIILPLAITVAVFAFAMVMIKMGGLRGIMETRAYGESESWRGVGKYRTPMRSLVILLLLAFTLFRKNPREISLLLAGIILVTCFIGQLITGGLAGARYETIFMAVWVMGIIHYFWRNIKPAHILAGMIPLLLFAYVYGLFKASGRGFLAAMRGETTLQQVAGETRKSMAGLLISDLARADIQAWMLFRRTDTSFSFNYRFGKTYLFSPVWVIPDFLLPYQKMPDSYKTRTGTAFTFGEGFYVPGDLGARSLRVYGLAGEAIMNFGLVGVPLMFAVWGFFVGYFRRKWFSWPIGDSRVFFAPHLIILLLLALISDSDNVFAYFWTFGLISITVIRLLSSVVPKSQVTESETDGTSSYDMTQPAGEVL
jgi:hypothetical protein